MLNLLYLRKMSSMIKILYLILFYLIYRITDLVLLGVMLIQIGLNVFSGEPSESIKKFGKSLGIYLQQISEFLSYASEEKPFPFSDWPEAGLVESGALSSDAANSDTENSGSPKDLPNAALPEKTDKADDQNASKDIGKKDSGETPSS